MSNKTMVLFSLEGIVGVGKSTVLNNLRKFSPSKVRIVTEPVHLYASYASQYSNMCFNPLQESYEDLQKNAIPSQLHIIDCSLPYYIENILKYNNKNESLPIISERSVLSPFPFIQAYHKMGFHSLFGITYLKDYLLKSLEKSVDDFDFLGKKKSKVLPDYFIYLKLEPDVCFQRIKMRGRVGEENVSRDFLMQLDNAYIEFFDEFASIPVISLNISESSTEENVAEEVLRVIGDKTAK